MLNILSFIIMSIPTAFEVAMDKRQIKKEGTDKRKGNDVVWRVGLFLLAGLIQSRFTETTWWQGALLSAGIFILTFDYIMGYILTKRPTYLGTTSRIDRFLANFHWPFVLFFRGIIFAILATIYYDLDKVLYGNW